MKKSCPFYGTGKKNVPFGTTSTIGVRDCELFEYDREKLMIVILIIFFCRIAPQGPKIYLLTVLPLDPPSVCIWLLQQLVKVPSSF